MQNGLLADTASITIGASTLTAKGTGFGTTNGATIVSYGDNRVDNKTVNGSASAMAPTR